MQQKQYTVYVSGIQPSGTMHLGNYFGAIKPMLDLRASSHDAELAMFVANYHAMTTQTDAKRLSEDTRIMVLTLRALGLDPHVQSTFPVVHEVAGLLSNVASFGLLRRNGAFKTKNGNADADPRTHGLFSYPLLMTADILVFGYRGPNTNIAVVVGPDQMQHLEIAQEIIAAFNLRFNANLPIPKAVCLSGVTVPGTDGRKMSKSYKNIIPVIGTDAEYKKAINSIVTDSMPVDEPKSPYNRTPYVLYDLLENDKAKAGEMARKYLAGGYGDGHAKKELLAKVIETFGPVCDRFRNMLDSAAEFQVQYTASDDRDSNARSHANSLVKYMRNKAGVVC